MSELTIRQIQKDDIFNGFLESLDSLRKTSDIDKKKADIKDKESRTTHGSGHKSPGQTTYRGA